MSARSTTRGSLPVLALLGALGYAPLASATSSEAVINVPGSPLCSTVAVADGVVSIDKVTPIASATETLFGVLGQETTYTVSADGFSLESWGSTVPVNYVMLTTLNTFTGKSDTRVFHYGISGVTGDTDLAAPVTSPDSTFLVYARFCYGLAPDLDPIRPGAGVIPDCDTDLGGELDESGITCPITITEGRVLISLDPDEPNFALAFCSCNLKPEDDEQFVRCDPDKILPDGEIPELELDGVCESGEPTIVPPLEMLGVQDPHSKICFTSGGKRFCYRHGKKKK